MYSIISRSPEETRALGRQLAKKLSQGAVLALYGPLGSGKTQLVKGLAEGLKVKRKVTSPTFILHNTYLYRISGRHGLLHHLDLYRLADLAQSEDLGLRELWMEKNAFTAIEWPEKISALLPKEHWSIHFAYGKKTHERKIRIKPARV